MDILEGWNENIFFQDYWGTKPCIIKNFVTDEQNLNFDINEISSLAMEDDLVSRIINYDSSKPDEIKLTHGPFDIDHLTTLPENKPWSLLIQDIDKKTDLFIDILETFKKIPIEYFDDVMASIGNKNSGTGPHLDWYNVFILQTHGHKNWRIEQKKRSFKDHDESLLDNLELKILKNFNDYYEHHLMPGEMLYIPPGHGHHGISTAEISMSFSIGFQGPRLISLIETYLSECLQNIHEDERVNYSVKSKGEIDISAWPKEININDLDNLKKLIEKAKEQDY